MAPLSKELETVNPAAEPATSPASTSAKSASGHMRADAVSLEVSVKVHGSRVTEVVRGTAPNTEPFEEQTTTMIVFPQGGVLRMSTTVNVGQMLVLTNLKSRQDAICRVVKVRTFTNLQGYVEVEFTHAQPGYWGAQFQSDSPAPKSKAAVPAPVQAQPVAAQPQVKEKTAADVSWAPAPPPTPKIADAPVVNAVQPPAVLPSTPVYVHPSRPASAFINIGSQEDVQASASATASTKAGAPVEIKHEIPVPVPAPPKISEPFDFPEAPPSAPPATLSMAELRGDDESEDESTEANAAVAVEEQQEPQADETSPALDSHSSFGSLSGGASLESDAADSSAKAAGSRPNWKLVGLSIAALLVVIAGGFFYSRKGSMGQNSAPAENVSSAPAAAASSANQPAASHTAQAVFPPAPRPAVSSAVPENNIAASAGAPATTPTPAPNKDSSAAHQPAVSAKPAAPSASPSIMAQSSNARPTTSQHADSNEAIDAPSVEAAPVPDSADGNAVTGIIGSTSSSPAPPVMKPEGEIKVGGQVTDPVLLSKIAPIYPVVAKEAGIEGDVVIKTSLDKNGNVGHMEIVSGPAMLRQPALEALRRWKYKPSTLNGEPVPVTILVTLKFHR
jgi:periplasmic protein TonB